jgi:phenylalanine-4-hydroxylase
VTLGQEVLFQPEWGVFDMTCGSQVISVFGGAADRPRYLGATGGYGQLPRTQKSNRPGQNSRLIELYEKVRELREKKITGKALSDELSKIHAELERDFQDDWLLRLELLELKSPDGPQIHTRLKEIAASAKDKEEMISRGLALL